MKKRNKQLALLAVVLGVSGLHSVGYGADYTTPQELLGGSTLTIESTDTVDIVKPTGGQSHGITISETGSILDIDGANVKGSGGLLMHILHAKDGGVININANSTIERSGGDWYVIGVKGVGSELNINGGVAITSNNGNGGGIYVVEGATATINSTAANPTIITNGGNVYYANSIQSGSTLNATGLVIRNASTQMGGTALLLSTSSATMDQSQITSTNKGISGYYNGNLLFTNGEIKTTGEQGFGLLSGDGYSARVENSLIQTEGKSGVGVYVKSGASADMVNTTVTTSGEAAHGLYMYGDGTATFTGSSLAVGAADAVGMVLNSDAASPSTLQKVTLDNSSVTTDYIGISHSNGNAVVELKNGAEITSQGFLASVNPSGNLHIDGSGNSALTGDIRVRSGGIVDVSLQDSRWTGAGEGMNALDLQDQGLWNMTGNSSAQSLNMAGNSVISYQTDLSSGSFGTLSVGDLSGSGIFDMRASVANLQGDLLQVTGTTAGTHTLNVHNDGQLPANGTEVITMVETADGGGSFGLQSQVELGGWTYDLRKVGNNWNLMTTGQSSVAASAAINLFNGSYLISYVEMQTLMKRMGDLRQGAERNGVWAKVYGGEFESDGDSFIRGYDMDYSGLQVGGDRKFVLKDGKGDVYLGGMFNYTKGDLDYGRNGDGSIDSKALGIYGTYVAPSGFYTDLVLKYSWMDNDFKALDSAQERVTGSNIETGGFSASLEVGKRFFLQKEKEKQGWYIEPQAQISFGHQSGDSFTASNGLQVRVDDYNSLLGRIGANIGYEIKGGKNPINLYGKVSYVHEFDGDVDYRLNGTRVSTDFGDHWWTYGVGVTAKLGTRHNVYLDIEKASGEKFDQSWGINGGYRYSW